jgi:fatty-acyl-CoA synthase
MKPTADRGLGQQLISSVLTTGALRYADREALYCGETGRRLTFRELNVRSNRLANSLTARGLRKGDVVGFLCSNRAEIVEIYFALAKTGIVGLPLNYRLAPSEMAELLAAMGAIGLICDARFGGVLELLRREVPALADVIWIGDSPPPQCLSYEALLAAAPCSEPDVEIAESDPYYFNLTSGTTGLPKAYVISHYSSATFFGSMFAFDIAAEDVILTVFPAFGRVGFVWIATALARGLRVVLADFQAEEVLRLIESERVTYTMLVPTMGAMLLASPELSRRSLASLRVVAYAGSSLPETIRDQSIARLCPNLYEGYGLQEAGWLTVSTAADRARKPDSIGRPVLFADVKIVDAAGASLPPGEIGEIISRSPSGATTYFQSPVRSAEAFRNGWFHSGDLGRRDEEGFIYLCGRIKDMIISGGQNIHSAEIESTLLKIPGVKECAVIGLPDSTWGERVVAVIVVDEPASVSLDSVREFCRARIAGFKIPREVHTRVDPLPRTPTGKVQKFKLIERYGNGENPPR